MAFIVTLWIGNGAVLKSSSQWQLKELYKNKYFMTGTVQADID